MMKDATSAATMPTVARRPLRCAFIGSPPFSRQNCMYAGFHCKNGLHRACTRDVGRFAQTFLHSNRPVLTPHPARNLHPLPHSRRRLHLPHRQPRDQGKVPPPPPPHDHEGIRNMRENIEITKCETNRIHKYNNNNDTQRIGEMAAAKRLPRFARKLVSMKSSRNAKEAHRRTQAQGHRAQ